MFLISFLKKAIWFLLCLTVETLAMLSMSSVLSLQTIQKRETVMISCMIFLNGGGVLFKIQLLSSYFFDKSPVLLFDFC